MLSSLLTQPASLTPPADGVVQFTRLWVSSDGHTHLRQCTVRNLTRTPLPGGKTAQYVRDLNGTLDPTGLVVTQQTGDNPWHQCPTSQIVVTLAGGWFVNTTDGGHVEMREGAVLYQDDYRGLVVAGRQPQHYSGTLDGAPCNQLVVQVAPRAFPAPAPGTW